MTSPGALTGSTTKREWRVRPSIPPEVRRSLSSYSDLLAQLLYNRGIREAGQAERFLSSKTVSHDPMLLPGMEKAVERLAQAMRRKERTAIFGDFDVDGWPHPPLPLGGAASESTRTPTATWTSSQMRPGNESYGR